MGVSKNSGTPKWMVKIMENPIKMDDLGVPLFLETPICAMVKSRYIGDRLIPPLMTESLFHGYINPYYWIDEYIPCYMEIMGVDRPRHI